MNTRTLTFTAAAALSVALWACLVALVALARVLLSGGPNPTATEVLVWAVVVAGGGLAVAVGAVAALAEIESKDGES